MEKEDVEVGLKVTYEHEDPELKEHGIIKKFVGLNSVEVVYERQYGNTPILYTAFKGEETHITNLEKGWL